MEVRQLDLTLSDGTEIVADFRGRHAKQPLSSLEPGDRVRVETWQGRIARVRGDGQNVQTRDLPVAIANQWRTAVTLCRLLAALFTILAIGVVVRTLLRLVRRDAGEAWLGRGRP